MLVLFLCEPQEFYKPSLSLFEEVSCPLANGCSQLFRSYLYVPGLLHNKKYAVNQILLIRYF